MGSIGTYEGRFGDPDRYYAGGVGGGLDEPLSPRERELLRVLQEAAGEEPKEAVERALANARKGAHHALQRHTRLGSLARSWAGRADIQVSNRIPPEVLRLLGTLPEALIWVLARKPELKATERYGRAAADRFGMLASHFQIPPELTEDGVSQGPALLRTVLKQAAGAGVARRILECRGDVLGAYFFWAGRIELHWIVIWLVAADLDVSIEELTRVVLLHELAHAYTHLGPDADEHDWPTEAFAECDDRIVEGLAQFYTEWVCRGPHSKADSEPSGDLRAFLRLREQQSEPYWHYAERWQPEHPKQAEVIRQAMVLARSHRITEYSDFLDVLDAEAQKLG